MNEVVYRSGLFSYFNPCYTATSLAVHHFLEFLFYAAGWSVRQLSCIWLALNNHYQHWIKLRCEYIIFLWPSKPFWGLTISSATRCPCGHWRTSVEWRLNLGTNGILTNVVVKQNRKRPTWSCQHRGGAVSLRSRLLLWWRSWSQTSFMTCLHIKIIATKTRTSAQIFNVDVLILIIIRIIQAIQESTLQSPAFQKIAPPFLIRASRLPIMSLCQCTIIESPVFQKIA
jgi:hypothetical protein